MTQYESFLSNENFALAYNRLKTATRSFYKDIYYEDLRIFGYFLEENIENTITHLKSNIYKPEKCHKIFIPKKDNLVRPLSMLSFIDLLVYQAIVNIITDNSYDTIAPYYNKIIFGNIVNTSFSNPEDKNFFYQSWKKKWKRFNEESKKYFYDGYKFLSEFDIASYFDTIDHSILCQILHNNYKIEHSILDLLSNCLEAWTADSNHITLKADMGYRRGLSAPLFLQIFIYFI